MWILSDYGAVLCLPQPDEDWARMAAAARMESGTFHTAYWSRRIEYDRGDVSPLEYWTTALSQTPSAGQLEQLRALDVASWVHPNLDVVRAYENISDRYEFALLSNAPADLARVVETLDWMPELDPMLFSCDMRLTKPNPTIYKHVLQRLGVAADEVILVDDRPENIAAAAEVGMRTLHFRTAEDLDVLAAD